MRARPFSLRGRRFYNKLMDKIMMPSPPHRNVTSITETIIKILYKQSTILRTCQTLSNSTVLILYLDDLKIEFRDSVVFVRMARPIIDYCFLFIIELTWYFNELENKRYSFIRR